MHSLQKTLFSPPAIWQEGTQQQIETAGKGALGVRFYGRKASDGQPTPLVVHFHAGAFVSGSGASGSSIAQLLADAGAVVMSLDYPLAPAHPFPEAVEAGYAALLWAWKSRQKLAGKGAPVFVAGEEAGGNLAAAVALMARDQKSPELTGQILLSPMLNPCMGTASLRSAEAGMVGCKWADGWHQYLSRLENASHPYASPGTASRLGDLPPALLVTAQDDPMRDEALAYADRLREAGRHVHTAMVPAPTGWPGSYLQPESLQAAWAPAVRQQFRDFFSSVATFDDDTPLSAHPISIF